MGKKIWTSRLVLALMWAASCLAPLAWQPANAATPGLLPTDNSWRTFAKPLAIGPGAMLFFQRDGQQAVVWRMDWSTMAATSTRLTDFKLDDKRRATAVSTREGLWLLGPDTLLIRPDGRRVVARTGFNEPVALALQDGSVVAFGHARGGEGGGIVQLRFNPASQSIEVLQRGALAHAGASDKNTPALMPRYGQAVVLLKDGRLMMLGGDGQPLLASLITPAMAPGPWRVSAAAPMRHPRIGSAAMTLRDGRVVVTGAPHLDCRGEADEARSVEVYDPLLDRWTDLPPLPIVPCADSYGADTVAMTETSDGALVVGGHLEPTVQVLPRGTASPAGFDASWRTPSPFAVRRTGGVLQAISASEVVVAGGVSPRSGESASCCYATPGFDRLRIDVPQRSDSLALRHIGVGVAQRGSRVFAAAGRRFGFTGTGQLRYSGHAELIDLRAGTVRELPNVPFATGEAQARWLDDDEVLLKGVQASGDRGFARGENLASHVPPSSSDLAIFNIRSDRWRKVPMPPALQESALLEAHGHDAFFLSASGAVQQLNLKTGNLQALGQLPSGRQGAAARLVKDGRLVAAGGDAARERVSVIDEACESRQGAAGCPERYAGFGPMTPSTSAESLALGASSKGPSYLASTDLALLAKSSAIAIAKDGTVYMLMSDLQDEVHRLVRSRTGPKSWQALPMPAGGRLCRSDCALMVAADPRDPAQELLFFRQGAIDVTYADDNVANEPVKAWWWNTPSQAWDLVLKAADGMAARATPQALDPRALGKKGQVMMSLGWHLPTPILWMAP